MRPKQGSKDTVGCKDSFCLDELKESKENEIFKENISRLGIESFRNNESTGRICNEDKYQVTPLSNDPTQAISHENSIGSCRSNNSTQTSPHLLCLTAAILASESNDPKDLASTIRNLESTLNSKAETSMLVISERFGCRPKESMIECEIYQDDTGMMDRLASILYPAWYFLDDCQWKPEDYTKKADPLHVPKFAISECINILQTLGPWCAASIAENLICQLEKIIKHENNQMLKMFQRYTLTQLRMVVREFEIGFQPDYEVEQLLEYTTPKVKECVNVLRKYKPDMDFMIITKENEGDDTMSDFSDDDMNDDDDDDSLDLSGSDDEDDGKGGNSK